MWDLLKMSKKTFPCGHKGRGKYCHRCERERRLAEAKIKEKNEREELFESDRLNLRPLQHASLIDKARKIISDIEQGEHYSKYKGKKLRYDRNVVSVPVNQDYRLIFRETESGIEVQELLNHEDYNVKKPGEKT